MKKISTSGFMVSFSLKAIKEKGAFRTGILMDLDCEGSSTMLKNISDSKLFSIEHEWLLVEEINETSTFQITRHTKDYHDIYALPGSRVTLAQVSIREGLVAFYDVYRIAMWTKMKFKLIARQPLSSGVPIPVREERRDFEGVILRTVTVILIPKVFDGFWRIDNNEGDAYAKAVIFLIHYIAQHLNFSMTLRVENTYGYLDEHDRFDGAMGRFQRGEVDVGAVAAMMREERRKAVDFTGDVLQMRTPFVFKRPQLSTMTNIYLLPFSLYVWIVCFVTSIAAGIVLYFSYYVGGSSKKIANKKDISVREITTIILASICQQGPEPIREIPVGRIVLFIFELYIFSLFVAYSAKIVALLRSSTETIKTVSDLTNSPLTIGIQDLYYNRLYLKETDNKELREFIRKKINPRGNDVFMTPEEGLAKVKSGLFAYQCETNWMYRIVSETYSETEKCSLSTLNPFLLPRNSIPVQKRSGIREHITRSIAWQREAGLMQRAITAVYFTKPVCNQKAGFTSVSLIDFRPALEVIAIGVLLSFSLLFVEFIFKIRSNIMKRLKRRELNKRLKNKWM